MGQGLTVTNSQRRLEFVNPALASMLGYEPSELAGMSADEISVAEDRAMQSAHQATRRAGHTTSYETYLQRRDGSAVLVQVTGAPRFVNGEFVGSIAVVTDMTERNLAWEGAAGQRKTLPHPDRIFAGSEYCPPRTDNYLCQSGGLQIVWCAFGAATHRQIRG